MKGGLIGINRKHYLENREYILYSNFDRGHSISYLYYFNIYHISNNLSMPLDPPTLLCTKRQFYPTKMPKSIKHTKSNVSLGKRNKLSHFSVFLSSLSLSFSFFFVRVVGVISIWDTTGGGGGGAQKISYEERGSSYTTVATR